MQRAHVIAISFSDLSGNNEYVYPPNIECKHCQSRQLYLASIFVEILILIETISICSQV